MQQIREILRPELGDQEQLDRRRRDLSPFFRVERTSDGRNAKYELVGLKERTESEALGISERVRAEVLRLGRCEQCGRTPREHGVRLQVDHKMPQSWGGTNAIENLQALCEECNRGKKAYYESLDRWGPAIAEAAGHEEVHRRLLRLLELVHPGEVRSDVLEIVAHQHQYQEDWHKRLRETRELGWDYSWRKEADERGRVWVFYRLTQRGRLPPSGTFRAAVAAAERLRKRT